MILTIHQRHYVRAHWCFEIPHPTRVAPLADLSDFSVATASLAHPRSWRRRFYSGSEGLKVSGMLKVVGGPFFRQKFIVQPRGKEVRFGHSLFAAKYALPRRLAHGTLTL